jgi:hypothetical protein
VKLLLFWEGMWWAVTGTLLWARHNCYWNITLSKALLLLLHNALKY